MSDVLVTGGTGELGRALVPALLAAGHHPRVMSRRSGAGNVVADLATGSGLVAAVSGADVVVHAATDPAGDLQTVDVDGTGRLVRACREAAVSHLVYVSIVGVDRSPLKYYRAKLDAERIVSRSGIPHSIVRVAQFSSLVTAITASLRLGPICLAPVGMSAEPVAVEEVATVLVERIGAGPTSDVEEFAGPERLSTRRAARLWLRARGRHALIVPLWVPGKAARAYRSGANLAAPGARRGTVGFADWLDHHPDGKRPVRRSRDEQGDGR